MLSRFSIRRPVTMIMILLVALLAGLVSLSSLKLSLLPNMNIPISAVYTTYAGAAPEEIETLITKPLEETLATIPNIDTINSISSDGTSIVILQFTGNTDIDMASLDVREKVDLVKAALPGGAESPMVIKIDPNMLSQLAIGVSSETRNLYELKDILEDDVENRIKRLDGVASVDFAGGLEQEIQITVHPEALSGFHVTEAQISQLLAAENQNYSAGRIQQGDSKLLIRSVGEFQSLDDIRNLPITTPSGAVIHLADVADVEKVDTDNTTYAMINRQQGIVMTVQKQSDANTVEVADGVRSELQKLSGEYPDISFHFLMDDSDYIKRSLNNVLSTLLIACLLAILVIFLFLVEIKGSLIIAVSIPSSVIVTFALMYVSGIDFNIISLGGLTIGIGMLVDNSIVVLESVYRHFNNGKDAAAAALDGTKEVASSIAAGTITTCCVFIPLMFVGGTVGDIFRDLSLTICYSLGASLVMALTFVPMACSKLMKRDSGQTSAKIRFPAAKRLTDSFRRVIDKIEGIYSRMINWALDRKKKAALITLAIFVLTCLSVPLAGVDFMPAMDQGMLSISIEMPSGAVLDESIQMIDRVSEAISDIPEMTGNFAMVGGAGISAGASADTATVYVNLVDKAERKRSADSVADDIRRRVENISGAKITVSSSASAMGSYSSSGVSLRITGDDNDELRSIGNDLVGLISSVDGTRDVTCSAEKSVPEANISIDRSRASAYGITSAQISDAVRKAVTGTVVTEYKVNGNELDVRIRNDKDSLTYLADLKNISIATSYGASIPLSEVADISVKDGPVSIDRYNQQRSVTVDASIYGRDLNSVKKDVSEKLASYHMPLGYSYEYTGYTEQMGDSVRDLLIALVVALLLVYMVMVAQFQKYLNPFIIMFSIPLALSGGLFGLFLCGFSISAAALMGLIMLVGMVVNNAIMLIDYTDQLRAEGCSCRQALVQSGITRIRPILMTTLTTVLGLLPMAVTTSSGTEMTKPLAVVTIFGMMFSMFATLIFIPVLYTVLDNFRIKRAARRLNKTAAGGIL